MGAAVSVKIVSKTGDDNGKKKPLKRKTAGITDRVLPNDTGSSTVKRDKNNIPLANPPRHKSLLGNLPVPATEGKPYLEKAKLLSQVEILLLKGVTTPGHISATLGVAPSTASKCIEQVHFQWAMLGGMSRMQQLKGEAKARLDLITNELWVMYSNTTDEKLKVVCLNQLGSVHDKKLMLEGLTPKTLPLIAVEGLTGATKTVEDRVSEHSELISLADALVLYTKNNKNTQEEIEDAKYMEIPYKDEN